MKVYMAVTPDEYELPVHIEDSVKNLSMKTGVTNGAILCAITHNCSGRNNGNRFKRVEVEEGEDGLDEYNVYRYGILKHCRVSKKEAAVISSIDESLVDEYAKKELIINGTWRIQKNANKSKDLINPDTQGWRVNFKDNWDRTTSLLKLSGKIVNIRLAPKEISNATDNM